MERLAGRLLGAGSAGGATWRDRFSRGAIGSVARRTVASGWTGQQRRAGGTPACGDGAKGGRSIGVAQRQPWRPTLMQPWDVAVGGRNADDARTYPRGSATTEPSDSPAERPASGPWANRCIRLGGRPAGSGCCILPVQSLNRPKANVTFCPPNPKLLLSATFSLEGRATLGT